MYKIIYVDLLSITFHKGDRLLKAISHHSCYIIDPSHLLWSIAMLVLKANPYDTILHNLN
jgi:hypothetical protein